MPSRGSLRAYDATSTDVRGRLALACIVGLATLTWQVAGRGGPIAFDGAVMAWLQSPPESLARLMVVVSLTGGAFATGTYAAVLVAVAVWRRRFATAAAVACVVYGGAVLNVTLKHLVARPRPDLGRLPELSSYAFPSGHAAAATVFGGLVLMLTAPAGPVRGVATAARIMGIAGWVAVVAMSRIVLHAHYPTDVVGGILEGAAWLALATLLLDRAHVEWRLPDRRHRAAIS